jgi:hypothetical protein
VGFFFNCKNGTFILSNPRSQQASGRRSTSYTARPLGPALSNIGDFFMKRFLYFHSKKPKVAFFKYLFTLLFSDIPNHELSNYADAALTVFGHSRHQCLCTTNLIEFRQASGSKYEYKACMFYSGVAVQTLKEICTCTSVPLGPLWSSTLN